jgi:thioredoxin-related protein
MRCVRYAKSADPIINFQLTKANKMKKGILILLTWSLPLLLIAQNNASTLPYLSKDGPGATEDKGIKWVTGLTWEQIKQKAKAENKYIFIDAYTTWCGPCKMMDQYVYPNDTVSDLFNQHFIAVKAQMDQTDKDMQSIKDWYNDSERIEDDYAVIAYPSLIFLSPESTPLYKMEGFRPIQAFVDTAKLVLTNSTVYNDPYKEYRELVKAYKKGIKQYDRMPYMIRTAFKLNDADLGREIFKDHLNYVLTLNENERYTKSNIELWSSGSLKLDSKVLQFFLKDGNKIDQVMNRKGYATGVVDKTIQRKIVDSFFKMQKGETTTISGAKLPNSEIMFVKLPVSMGGKITPDYVEADWERLKKMIHKSFKKDYVERNVLTARYRWYTQHQNLLAAVDVKLIELGKKSGELIDNQAAEGINTISWITFLYANDDKLLKRVLEWEAKIVQMNAKNYWLDTYANLLYKLKRTNEAIQWEEKAINATNPTDQLKKKKYKNVIEKMKKGEPTYEEEGAVWM